MLKKQNIKVSGRNNIIKADLKAVGEAGYAADNKTEVMIGIAQKAKGGVDAGTLLIDGSESASAFGRITFKVTKIKVIPF